MKHKIRWKLFGCFAVVLLLFALIVGVLFTSLFGEYSIDHHEEELLVKAKNIAVTLEEQIGNGAEPHSAFAQYFHTVDKLLPEELWLVDKGEHHISQGLENHNASYDELPGSVKDILGNVFNGEIVSSQEFSPMLNEPCLTMGVPICDQQGNIIAALLVHSSVAGMEEAINEGIRFLLMASFVAMGIALIASIVMSTVFIHPIRSMQIAANHMAEGDYTIATGVSSKDELGALARDLDILACRLNQASKESEKMEQLRRDFVSNVSHELRTPVTVLRSSLEALCEDVITDKDAVNEYHSSMLTETIHLQRMIGDLLEVSRLQNPDYAMQFNPIDLVAVTDDAIRAANQIAGPKGISIVRETKDTTAIVYGDYGRVRQLILILLDNAIKFSPKNDTVEIRISSTNTSYTLTVVDHGPGVSEQDLPYVFDRFYTSQSTSNPQGTGLGLYIAKQIALRHNADIRLENLKDLGCRFIITIPRSDRA